MTESDEIKESVSAGERLRAAREAKKMSLEEVASQTRIPLRHLQSLENSEWDQLPAATYTIGFAKSYASAVGIDRNEIAEDLRAEMGGQRPDYSNPEVFEPVDPARTMPKWLVLGALGAIVLLVIVLTWLNERSLEPEAGPSPEVASSGPAADRQAATQPDPARQQPQAAPATGPVVLTATEDAWIQVTDQGKTLFSGILSAGQNYAVPQTAQAPVLKAGKPEALRVTVGNSVAPPVGPPGRVASNVSLDPSSLLRGGTGGTPAASTPPAPSAPPAVSNLAG